MKNQFFFFSQFHVTEETSEYRAKAKLKREITSALRNKTVSHSDRYHHVDIF